MKERSSNLTGERGFTRFSPDQADSAQLDFSNGEDISKFKLEMNGLIFEESYTGCGLVCIKDKKIEKGNFLMIKIGHIGPLYSEIIWVKEIADDLLRFGVKFIEA